MSPRRNRRRDERARPVDPGGAGRLGATQQWNDGDWLVRAIPAVAATKPYRCPGCDHVIAAGVGHVVAWPADGRGGAGDRRHWHSGCWRARDRRTPNVQRSRGAPRYG
jgi:hypothetical protein